MTASPEGKQKGEPVTLPVELNSVELNEGPQSNSTPSHWLIIKTSFAYRNHDKYFSHINQPGMLLKIDSERSKITGLKGPCGLKGLTRCSRRSRQTAWMGWSKVVLELEPSGDRLPGRKWSIRSWPRPESQARPPSNRHKTARILDSFPPCNKISSRRW